VDKMNFAELMLKRNDSEKRFPNESVPGSTSPLSWAEVVEEFIYTKVVLIVCVFGIGGNLLNLIILSQRSLVCTMKRMEKSAHYGLIALAVSDFFVCLAVLSGVICDTGKKNGGFTHDSFDFRLVHELYSYKANTNC